jgi:hypothetical protein
MVTCFPVSAFAEIIFWPDAIVEKNKKRNKTKTGWRMIKIFKN